MATYAHLPPPNALQREILAILTEHSPKTLSVKDIASHLPDEKPDTVSRSIHRMEEKGRIRKHLRGNYELLHPPVKPNSTTEHQMKNAKSVSETVPPTPQDLLPTIETIPLMASVNKSVPTSNLKNAKNLSETLSLPSNAQHVLQPVKLG